MSRARFLCWVLTLYCVAAITGGQARAGSFVLNLTTDPSLGAIQGVVDASANPGEQWTSAEIGFAPITLSQGDVLTLSIAFSGGLSLQLQSGVYNTGREVLDFDMLPIAAAIDLQASSTLSSFSGVAGDLDVALPVTSSFTAGGQITGVVAVDMTNTSFAFDGFTIETTYTSLTGGPVAISSVLLNATAEDVALVPEPASALLLAAGLAILARLRAARSRG